MEINESSNPKSPGQLTSHYAPRMPLYLGPIQTLIDQYKGKKIGILCFGPTPKEWNHVGVVKNLSVTGDTSEAGSNVFRMLRELDSLKLDLILAEPIPPTGLGAAVNDRLKRASVK